MHVVETKWQISRRKLEKAIKELQRRDWLKLVIVGTARAEEQMDSLRVEQVKVALKDRLDILRRLDEEIVNLNDDGDQVVVEIEESDTINETISQMLVVLNSHARVSSSIVGCTDSMAKLPKLNLPVFTDEVTGVVHILGFV